MSSIRAAGVLIVAASVVLACESAALDQVLTIALPTDKFAGPCRAWLYPCEGSYWVCTTDAAYWKFKFHVPGSVPDCPTVYPNPTPPPPPGDCQLVNNTCKFTESTLKCNASLKQFYGNKCVPVTDPEYTASAKSNGLSAQAKGFGQYPPPNQLCLPINNSCQWYNPCISWKELYTDGNICGSLDEYYAFLYGQPPQSTLHSGQISNSDSKDLDIDPPGQCAIRNDHCGWYECASWLDWCQSYWTCGTTYDKQTYFATPPPPCPAPPPGHHPPVQPGTCRLNITSGRCNFFPNITNPCSQSIYPPGFVAHCDVLQKQWTYAGKCVEFYYHPCGEEREGYNVFASEQECIKTCSHKDPCHQPIYPPGYKPTCRLLVNQWTYDAQSGQCVEFEYYPCGEDRDGYDVFATKDECINTCQH